MRDKSDADDMYVVKKEKKAKKKRNNMPKDMKVAGVATALKNSQKEMGKAKLIKVKPMKK